MVTVDDSWARGPKFKSRHYTLDGYHYNITHLIKKKKLQILMEWWCKFFLHHPVCKPHSWPQLFSSVRLIIFIIVAAVVVLCCCCCCCCCCCYCCQHQSSILEWCYLPNVMTEGTKKKGVSQPQFIWYALSLSLSLSHTHTHTHIHTSAHTYIYIYIYTHNASLLRSFSFLPLSFKHTDTYTHTHTKAYTQTHSLSLFFLLSLTPSMPFYPVIG